MWVELRTEQGDLLVEPGQVGHRPDPGPGFKCGGRIFEVLPGPEEWVRRRVESTDGTKIVRVLVVRARLVADVPAVTSPKGTPLPMSPIATRVARFTRPLGRAARIDGERAQRNRAEASGER